MKIRNFWATTLLAASLVSLAGGAHAQEGNPNTTSAERNKTKGTDVQFVDSKDSYWVNRGFNDTYFGTPGSLNEVHSEQNQNRSGQKLNSIYHPTQIVELKVHGQVVKPNPPLIINGKVVNSSPRP